MSGKQADALDNAQLRELAPLHDIPLRISIEIGRKKIKIRDLLKLEPNAIFAIKKPAGEPLEICINGHHVGRGEVITVEQTSGIRIIEVFKLGSGMSEMVEP